jgi:hypothetical protein
VFLLATALDRPGTSRTGMAHVVLLALAVSV